MVANLSLETYSAMVISCRMRKF